MSQEMTKCDVLSEKIIRLEHEVREKDAEIERLKAEAVKKEASFNEAMTIVEKKAIEIYHHFIPRRVQHC